MVASLLSISTLFLTGYISTEQWKWDVLAPINFNSVQFTVSVGDDTIYSELFSPTTSYEKTFANEPVLDHFSNSENEDITFGLKIYAREVSVVQYNTVFAILNAERLVNYFEHPTILETISLYISYRVNLFFLQNSRSLFLTPPGEVSAFYAAGKESDFGLFLPGSDIDYFSYSTDRGTFTSVGNGMGRLEFGCTTKVFGNVPEPSMLLLTIGMFFAFGARKWSK